MALPHAFDRLESQPVMFAPNAPPCTPNVPCSHNLMPYLQLIAATVANDVSSKASMHQLRVFAYNLISSNYWRNQAFEELVGFVVGMIDLSLAKREYVNVEQAIRERTEMGVSLFTSKIAGMFQELRSYCDNAVMAAAYQNLTFYQNMVAEINNFQNRSMGGQPFQNRPPMMGNQQPIYQHQQPMPQQQQIFSRYSQPQETIGNAVGTSPSFRYETNQNTQSPSEVVQQSRFFGGNQERTFIPQVQVIEPARTFTTVSEMLEEVVTSNEWRPSVTQNYRTMADPRTHKKIYVREGNDVIEIVQPLEESEMDRSKHTITLLGSVYPMDGVVRMDEVSKQVEALAAVQSTDILTAGISYLETKEPQPIMTHISPTPNVDIFLDVAIFEGLKEKAHSQRNDPTRNAFRRFSTIAMPFITASNYRNMLEVLKSFKTFNEMAAKLVTYADSIRVLTEQRPERKDELLDTATFLDHLDRRLTSRINDFLKNKLSLETHIDSFTEDVGSLRGHLEKRFSPRYSAAFDKFETDSIGTFIELMAVEDENEILESLGNFEDKLSYTLMPETYSFTYVDLFAKELGIDLEEGEVAIISEKDSNVLFKIAQSLDYQREAVSSIPVHNLLITQERKIFKLHNAALNNRTYLISR